MSVAAALLAAGGGTRFEGAVPKPLAPLHGRALVAWALDAVRGSGLDPAVVVVAPGDTGVRRAVPSRFEVVEAARAADGIAHSLRAALDALEPREVVRAVCVGLADQPLVGPGSYRRLADAFAAGATLAVATYDGRRGNPVLLARSLWPRTRALEEDVGARALMHDHDVVEVDCTGTGDPRDVDTLDDLQALEEETR